MLASVPPLVTPSIKRRIAALPYEGLLVTALLFIAAFPAAGLKGITLSGAPLYVFQAYLFCVTAAYFTWFWRHGGQTLAMKTWRFRVVRKNGAALDFTTAFTRFLFSAMFYAPACAGLVLLFFPSHVNRAIAMWAFLPMIATLLWARHDADRQFLHDRMAGTRLVGVPVQKRNSA
jgi:uncharacterized RDD family membrane protein YckC